MSGQCMATKDTEDFIIASDLLIALRLATSWLQVDAGYVTRGMVVGQEFQASRG